ncbi:MAG: prepilin-type N-terminal cleavage/methylation domain-containing protein [Planctomycetota bacterium]
MINNKCGNSGFTLLEVIVALSIMMIGISSAFALFAAATALHKRSIDQTNSGLIAETVLSNLDLKLTTGIELSDLQIVNGALPEYPNYTYELILVPLDADEREIYIDLAVKWKRGGKLCEQVFNSIRLRRLPFKER